VKLDAAENRATSNFDSVLIINVLARPGTPFENAMAAAKEARSAILR